MQEVACPLCETVQPLSLECVECGARLPGVAAVLDVLTPPVEGLEQTRLDTSAADAPPEEVPGLELTPIADPHLDIADERLAEMTEDDRATDLDLPTPEPDKTTCIYCGAAVTGRVCDACGRSVTKVAPPPRGGQGDEQGQLICPGCQSKVPWVAFCEKCKTPLPLKELF